MKLLELGISPQTGCIRFYMWQYFMKNEVVQNFHFDLRGQDSEVKKVISSAILEQD